MGSFLTPFISAAAGLIGVALVGYLTNYLERKKTRREFITRQLLEFYGPLLSMRTEIRSRGELRVKMEKIQDKILMDKIHDDGLDCLSEADAVVIVPMAKTISDESSIFTTISTYWFSLYIPEPR